MGAYSEAIRDYDQAIRLNPEVARFYIHRGGAYRKLKKVQQAIADFNRALELKPDYAAAYGNRGMTYAKSGDTGSACRDFAKARQLGDDSFWKWALQQQYCSAP